MKNRFTVLFVLAAMLLGGVSAFAQDYEGEFYYSVPKIRVAVQGGYARRLAKFQESGNELMDTHNKRLLGGLIYGADFTYYFSDSFGLGLKYSDMHTTSKDAVVNEAGQSGMYSEAMDIMFVGPMVSSRRVGASGNGIFMLNYGAGYISYKDSGRIISDEICLTAPTLGLCLELGYDYRLMNNMFIGATLGAINGTLKSYTQTVNGYSQKITLDADQREGLLHGYLTLGLRYYL